MRPTAAEIRSLLPIRATAGDHEEEAAWPG